MKHLKSLTIALIFALGLAILPVSADTPLDIEIISGMVCPSEGPCTGTFTATGPAVDEGYFCPSGTVEDEVAVGRQSPQNLFLRVHKHFICDDGSGTIEMNMNVLIKDTGSIVRWNIIPGSGDYPGLLGTGNLIAEGTDTGVLDHYYGKLHIK